MFPRIYPECVSYDQIFLVSFVIKRLRILFSENADIHRQKLKFINLSIISYYNIPMPSTQCFLAVQAHCESVFKQSLRYHHFSLFCYSCQSNKEIILSSLHFPCSVEICKSAKKIHRTLFWTEYYFRKALDWGKAARHDWRQSHLIAHISNN